MKYCSWWAKVRGGANKDRIVLVSAVAKGEGTEDEQCVVITPTSREPLILSDGEDTHMCFMYTTNLERLEVSPEWVRRLCAD